jgi:Transcription factor WhiB
MAPHVSETVDLGPVRALSDDALWKARERGDCFGSPAPDDWFPPEPPPGQDQARRCWETYAAGLCAACPVVAECLELEVRVASGTACGGSPVRSSGIWGGLMPWQREPLVRSRREGAAA